MTLPVKRTWELEEHPEKRRFSILYFYSVTNVGSLKSLKVLKWGNLDLSCVAGKLTANDSK